MTAISIQLPDSLAKKAGELAERDGVSLDQFISTAVSEKLSSWIAEGNIELRAPAGRSSWMRSARCRTFRRQKTTAYNRRAN